MPIALNNTSIRCQDGLYSLNDLHAASGGENKNRPSLFMANQQTKDLISEIVIAGIPAFKTERGKYAGTYACKELVVAYAAWISPSFHLKVIRVFLNQQQPQALPKPEPRYDLPHARSVLSQMRDWANNALEGWNKQQLLGWCEQMEKTQIRCWTELDEISSHLVIALAMARRAKGVH